MEGDWVDYHKYKVYGEILDFQMIMVVMLSYFQRYTEFIASIASQLFMATIIFYYEKY